LNITNTFLRVIFLKQSPRTLATGWMISIQFAHDSKKDWLHLAWCDWDFSWSLALLRLILVLQITYDLDDQLWDISTNCSWLLKKFVIFSCKQVSSLMWLRL
jgi:hypothetical protein